MPGPGEPGDPIFRPDPDEDEHDAKAEEEIKKHEQRREAARKRIAEKHASLGGSGGFLGNPVSDVQDEPGGFSQQFQTGTILVRSGIARKAFEVHGLIAAKYFKLGGPAGFLGYPMSDERDTVFPGEGKASAFEGGVILWSRGAPEAFEVHGAIQAKYAQGFAITLGFPTTDETPTGDAVGRFNHFQRGSIFWHPNLGPHEVHGAIRSRYQQLGFEGSPLGYPTSDEQDMAGGRVSHFENGRIEFRPQTGASEVVNATRRRIRVVGKVTLHDSEKSFFNAGFDEDETKTFPVDATIDMFEANQRERLLTFAQGFGGEIRGELDIDAKVLPDQSAEVMCEARLFEGTSESTNDMEDHAGETAIVVPNNERFVRIVLASKGDLDFESDGADFRLSFTNTAF